MTTSPDVSMVAIDGRDALFFLIVRPGTPGPSGSNVVLEHGGSGLSKRQAAYILHELADRLDAEVDALPECPTCSPECTNRTHDRIYRTSGY